MALPPSATTITTASEAFSQPLPSVRQVHKQLNSALDEKTARLRTLVGGSYRQLLGTAEMIVDMRRDISLVEDTLGRVGERCGRSVVGKRAAGLGKLGVAREGKDADLSWAARTKVLGGCVIVVGRVLSGRDVKREEEMGKGSKLVLAAKVLVLSRLLVKSLGGEKRNGEDGGDELLEDLKKKIASLRRRLLRVIERMLVRVDRERDDLTKALCAYSLATSSGAKDVLRHFLHVRGEAIAVAFEDEIAASHERTEKGGVMRAMVLYTRTLLDVQALVPRSLSEALQGLKGGPLLKDEAIRDLEVLRLDVCERWFADEIMFFMPYIKHDDLDGIQAVATLKGWAKKASEVLLQGVEQTLNRVSEFKTVIELRRKIFETWIQDSGKARGFDSSIMLDGLRDVVNRRLVILLDARVDKLHLVGSEVEAALGSQPSALNSQNMTLWDEDLLDMELNHGATAFKQAIISHVHGRKDALSRVVNGFETWRYLVEEMVFSIEQTKKERWDDDLDSLEDDLSLENRNTLLSNDDPAMLQDHLETGLEKSFIALHSKLASLSSTYKGSKNAGGVTIFILRVLRHLRTELPKRPDLFSFGISLIPDLHNALAMNVCSEPISIFLQSLAKQRRVSGRALWEGSPELPIYPSPATFKFFHGMTSSMASAGSDLWSPSAVRVLKEYLRETLGRELAIVMEPADVESTAVVNGHEEEETGKTETAVVNGHEENELEGTEASVVNGHEENELEGTEASVVDGREEEEESEKMEASAVDRHEEDESKRTEAAVDDSKSREALVSGEMAIQSLFDVLILQQYFSASSKSQQGDDLSGLKDSLVSHTKLPDSSLERLHQASQEHWKRTALLFGLLA